MSTIINQSEVEKLILAAVETRIKQIINEEADRAIAKAKERINAETDRLALYVLRQYEIHEMRDRLVIEVKKL